MDQIPGIPGIDGIKMPYAPWHFINEAFVCFMNGYSYACIACVAVCFEEWLRTLLKASPKVHFEKLIADAKGQDIISEEELVSINAIREHRNKSVHYDRKYFPDFVRGVTTNLKDPTISYPVEPYPTEAHRELPAFAFMTVFAYFDLNTAIKFFQKRYPQNPSIIACVYKFTLLGIEGLEPDKVVLRLSEKTRVVKPKNRFSVLMKRILRKR